jgi:hypothetical protein
VGKQAIFSFKENLIKHILILCVAFFSFNSIYFSVISVPVNDMGNLLSIISILLVTVCFANFAFTYNNSKTENIQMRILAHFTTFIFLLLTALLLEVLVISVGVTYHSMYNLVLGFSALLYLGIVLYDFWDFFKCFKK